MNDAKQKINLKKINQKINQQEQNIFNLEKQIQEEKSSLGSIIVNNREAASSVVRGAKAFSSILFGIGIPYALTANLLFAAIAFGSSILCYGVYSFGTRLDKHDKIWRKRCLRRIEQLKDKAKESKIILHELYQKANDLKDYGTVKKDIVLEEEIKKDLKKCSYKKEKREMQKNNFSKSMADKEENDEEDNFIIR